MFCIYELFSAIIATVLLYLHDNLHAKYLFMCEVAQCILMKIKIYFSAHISFILLCNDYQKKCIFVPLVLLKSFAAKVSPLDIHMYLFTIFKFDNFAKSTSSLKSFTIVMVSN